MHYRKIVLAYLKKIILDGNNYKAIIYLLENLNDINIQEFANRIYRKIDCYIKNNMLYDAKIWSEVCLEFYNMGYLKLDEKQEIYLKTINSTSFNNIKIRIDIIKLLIQEKKEEAIKLLKVFLEQNDNLNYEELALSLVEVSNPQNNYKYIRRFLYNLDINNVDIVNENLIQTKLENCIIYKNQEKKDKWQRVVNNLNIKNQERLVNYLEILEYFNQTNDSIEEIANKFNLSNEETLIFKIYLAHEFYKNNFNKNAEKLIRQVERSEEKTNRVLNLLNSTMNKKKDLKNEKKFFVLQRLI